VRKGTHWTVWQWVVFVVTLAFVGSATAVEAPVNPHLPLYEWTRAGAAIQLARVHVISRAASVPGKELLTLELRVSRTLWGSSGAAVRTYNVEQPAATTSRLKFPDPVWGRVDPEAAQEVLLVTGGRGSNLSDPRYVESIARADDPIIAALGDILDSEARRLSAEERSHIYFGWLAKSEPLHVLFGAEALATDQDLARLHVTPRVAREMGRVFLTHSDPYVSLSVGTWMWQRVWGKTVREGRIALINSAIRGLELQDPDIRRFSLEQLLTVDDTSLFSDPSVEKRPGTRAALRSARVSADPKRIEELARHIAP
jgi:hypothetical protein